MELRTRLAVARIQSFTPNPLANASGFECDPRRRSARRLGAFWTRREMTNDESNSKFEALMFETTTAGVGFEGRRPSVGPLCGVGRPAHNRLVGMESAGKPYYVSIRLRPSIIGLVG